MALSARAETDTGLEVVIKPPPGQLLGYFAHQSMGTICQLHIRKGDYIEKGDPFVTIDLKNTVFPKDQSFKARFVEAVSAHNLAGSSLPDTITFASPVSGTVIRLGANDAAGFHSGSDNICSPNLKSDYGFQYLTAVVDTSETPDQTILEANHRAAVTCARQEKSSLVRVAFIALFKILLLAAGLLVLRSAPAPSGPLPELLTPVVVLAGLFVLLVLGTVALASLAELIGAVRQIGRFESVIAEVERVQPDAASASSQRPASRSSLKGAEEQARASFQPTPAGKTAPPPVDRAHRIESTDAAPSSSPTLGKRQRDFVTLCDPQTGRFPDAEVRRIAYADFEEHLQQPMSDRAFDVKFSDWFHPDKAAIRRLTKDQLHELYTTFMAME